jgi:small subunit ribosomal protein S17
MSSEPSNQPAAPARTLRPKRYGVVMSDGRNKTIAVRVSYNVKHTKYGKIIRRRTVLHAHDEQNQARKGDQVEIVACRPYSKTKHWRLLRIIGSMQGGVAG